MATFAKSTFSHTAYAAFRPTYPPTLYTSHLLPYHRGPRRTLLDLGCGPGTVTRPLSHFFTRVLATDPSAGMLSTARTLTPADQYPNITYRSSSAESLPFIADGEIDMVVAAQAAHWFSYPEFWAEMARIVRPGGTVAAWGYKDFAFPWRMEASRLVGEYTYGEGTLGPYWVQPGRSRVQGRLRSVDPPGEGWEEVERWEYETVFEDGVELGELGYEQRVKEDFGMSGRLVKVGEPLMRFEMALGKVELYTRTWSAVHAWKEAHPGRVSRGEGGEGDIVDELFDRLREVVPEWAGEGWRDKVVDIELGHGVVCARRKGGGFSY